jgi:hypothetical protein
LFALDSLDFGTRILSRSLLRAINQNDKANEVMELFSQKSANDGRAKLFKQKHHYLQAIKANSGRYT